MISQRPPQVGSAVGPACSQRLPFSPRFPPFWKSTRIPSKPSPFILAGLPQTPPATATLRISGS